MAVTKIWNIRGKADAPLSYAVDPEKTQREFTDAELSLNNTLVSARNCTSVIGCFSGPEFGRVFRIPSRISNTYIYLTASPKNHLSGSKKSLMPSMYSWASSHRPSLAMKLQSIDTSFSICLV